MPDHYNEKLYDPSGKDITEKVKKAHKKEELDIFNSKTSHNKKVND